MKSNPRTLKKLERLAETYEALIFSETGTLALESFETETHFREVPDDGQPWKAAETGLCWGRPWGSAWFRGRVEVRSEDAGNDLYIRSGLGGVETLFFVNGEPQGIFSKSLETGARGNHHTLRFHRAGDAAGTYDLAFEAYAGHPCVGTQPLDPREKTAGEPSFYRHSAGPVRVMRRNGEVKDFVFDLKTLLQLAAILPETGTRCGSIRRGLMEVFALVPQCPGEMEESEWMPLLGEARERMQPLLACTNGSTAAFAGLTGHSHMDTAWLWTSKETIRKCARTFSNALSLMEQYPEYRFIQSSPIHAEMMLEHYPRLFARIKEKVAEGRWEPNGGMYVESDGNMPSGESFIRQFLYGQAFTRTHFEYTADTFWLPDTFGYSGAFPQILKGCGIKYFLTTKLSWNDTTAFPYDTFVWKGIDGTELLVHFNSIMSPPDARTLVRKLDQGGIRHPDVSDKKLISYGQGDGGGGPTFEEIEMSRRVKDLEGCPRSAHMSVSDFMALLAADQARYPRYHGELYVELHRGVQTVQALIKKRNRQCESALRELEMLDVLGDGPGLPPLDAERVRGLWKVLLKNQFHDILPGTSIPEEHDESLRATGELLEKAESMLQAQWQTTLQAGEGCTVLNPFSWETTADVEVEALPQGQTLGSEINATQTFETVDGERKTVVEGLYRAPLSLSGFERVPLCVESPLPFDFKGDRLTTPFYEVSFADNGGLDSLVDRRSGRELRGAGAPLNTFTLGEDLPNMWDNWDIDDDQILKMKPVGSPETVERTLGPLQVRIRQTFRLGRSSTLWQDMVFHKNSARIDFETKVDWQETHSLLKTGFDLSVTAMNFKSDIQFGWIERPTHRNTPYDQAKFEVCQHKWSDLNEPGYGVALLNDCKYGVSVYGSDLRLSLLKSGGHPDPRGDRGLHRFRYGLFPHAGPFRAETVVREAYAFNHRSRVFPGYLPEDLPARVRVDAPNVVVETLKRAEDGNGWILRLFEAEGTACRCGLDFGGSPCRIEQTNLLEETEALLLERGTRLDLTLRAFGIVTLRVL